MGGRSGSRKKRGDIYSIETDIYTTIKKGKYSNIIETHVRQRKRKKKKTDLPGK